MQISLSISDLYEAAFGYRTAAYGATFGGQGRQAFDNGGMQFKPLAARRENTDAGGANYWSQGPDGRDYYMPVLLNDYELPYPVLSVRGRKRIIDTPLVERQGEVSEMISIESYSVLIRGVIIDRDKQFPEQIVQDLAALFALPAALPIICPITEMWLPASTDGQRYVTIRDFDFPEVRGVMGVRAYSMECRSDLDFNLLKID